MKREHSQARGEGVPANQYYGALCLEAYCQHFGVADTAISELVLHLKAMKTAKNWPEWNGALNELEVAGHGDPLPERVLAQLPADRTAEFEALLERTVLIGCEDFYAADTGADVKSFQIVQDMLAKAGVAVPSFEITDTGDRS